MKDVNLYWPVYKNLEKELFELTYSVYFDDFHFEYIKDDKGKYIKTPPYSLKIGDLLVRCCTEIEALIQKLTNGKDDEVKNTPSVDKSREITIGCRLKYLHHTWNLDKKIVLVSCSNMFFQNEDNKSFIPFGYSKDDENDYISAYNALKHHRNTETIYKGNIRFLLRAMAALYLLNIYYRDETFELGKQNGVHKSFDSSLQSELFSIKYEMLTHSNYKAEEMRTFVDATYVVIFTKSSYAKIQEEVLGMQGELQKLLLKTIEERPEETLPKITSGANALEVLQKLNVDIFDAVMPVGRALVDGNCEAILNKNQSLIDYAIDN